MEPEYLLTCSQKPPILSYPKPEELRPRFHTLLIFKTYSVYVNITFQSTPACPNIPFPSGFQSKIVFASSPCMLYVRLSHLP